MKPHVFIARPVPPQVEAYLAEHCLFSKWDGDGPIPRERLLASLAEADGLLTSGTRIDAELLEHAPRLKAVSNISVGYNNFDLEAMKARGVIGTNTPAVLNDTVADLIFALMLAVARRVPELDQYVKQGKWKRGDDEILFGLDVHHKTLGVIGMGEIGEAVARRGRFGFGMDVLYHNRSRKPGTEAELDAVYCSMEELLQTSDFVVLMTPLTPETRGLIGERELAWMKPTAVFVNASRGATVDEAALTEALRQNASTAPGSTFSSASRLPRTIRCSACRTSSPCRISAPPPRRPAVKWRCWPRRTWPRRWPAAHRRTWSRSCVPKAGVTA